MATLVHCPASILIPGFSSFFSLVFGVLGWQIMYFRFLSMLSQKSLYIWEAMQRRGAVREKALSELLFP